MKPKLNPFIKAAVFLAVLIAILCVSAPLRLSAQVTSTTTIDMLTNGFPSIVNPVSQSNQIASVRVVQGKGMSLYWRGATSAGNSNQTVWVFPANDNAGTNFANQPWRLLLLPTNGTNYISLSTNFTAAELSGFTALNFGTTTNGHATGVMTNYACRVGIPN